MNDYIPQSLKENLRFLIVEVGNQVSALQNYMVNVSHSHVVEFVDRTGYAYNLKLRIQKDCHFHQAKLEMTQQDVSIFRSLHNIAANLDRIAELCRDCLQHASKLQKPDCLYMDEYALLLDRVALGISLIDKAVLDNDTQLAMKIAGLQQKLSKACATLTDNYTTLLKDKKNTEDLISSIFIAQSVKHMGDALLKISEAILSGNLGQPILMQQFQSLNEFVGKLSENETKNLVVETLAETRSGSNISAISNADNKEMIAVFKDGKKRKLKEERQSVASWHEIYPGIAPKILSYQKQGNSAALLIEHLDGMTIESIVLSGNKKMLQQAMQQLCKTLTSVWDSTRKKESVNARFMLQLQKRLTDVTTIHADFEQQQHKICQHKVISYKQLVRDVEVLEHKVLPPFSVYIHGDFNTDNIIYEPQAEKINFIDLHRSRYMDYVQDVSVFIVSNYRLQVLDDRIRERALGISLEFYLFASEYARKNGDKTFDYRLTLGLARSFATSTRFILDKSLAKAMFLRSRYLIELILRWGDRKPAKFCLPIEEIVFG